MSETFNVTLVTPKGEFRIVVRADQHIWDAAKEAGITLPAICRRGCAPAKLPDPPTAENILVVLLESERCAVRRLVGGVRHDLRQRSAYVRYGGAHPERRVEHEAWFIELLAWERDKKSVPSGHFRSGEPGEAPYSGDPPF